MEKQLLYIIGGIILFFIFARLGSGGIGCFFLLILAFVLWRIGVLSFILRIVWKVAEWIIVRIAAYYYKFFGAEESALYFSAKISSLLL